MQVTLVTTLDSAPGRAVAADHRRVCALLDASAQIELVLQHLAGQLATVRGQPRLELGMLKPKRMLARRPLDQPRKPRLRALEPRDRARLRPRRRALLAAPIVLITIHTFRRRLAHRAVSLPGADEQVEQIGSHASTSVSRSERDITPPLSPPLTGTPSETVANNPAGEPDRCPDPLEKLAY